METILLTSTKPGVACLTLNRPEKRNAIDGTMIRELSQGLKKLAVDDQTRVLLINGKGEHFCAGADIKWMQQIAQGSYDENCQDAEGLADLLYQLYTFPKPTIVLAHGATLGGGLGLVAGADMAIGDQAATFGFSEVKIGVTPSTISPYILASIGERQTRYYFLTGQRFDAMEAMRIGLIHQVAEDALEEAGLVLAETILQNAPEALIAAKQLIRQVGKEKVSIELAQKTAEHLATIRASAEAQEGLLAFIEKRKPKWISG